MRGEVVGRRPELAAVAELLGRIRTGPAAVVLKGPAGMGKTTIWSHAVERAQAEGCTVLAARPSGAEATLTYAALADLLASIDPAEVAELPLIQRRALDGALLRGDPGPEPVDHRAVATALLTLLRNLAGGAPVVVAVDDAQWLDGASSEALAFALRRLAPSRVGALVAIRVPELRADALIGAISPDWRTELDLEPLSAAEIHAILRGEFGHSPSRPTLVKLVSASGGNPFYAIEIARELFRLGEPAPGAALPVPDQIQALVQARVKRLPPTTREALLVASCLDSPRVDLVDEGALAAAEDAGIVRVSPDGRILFEHPLFAAAVHESAASSRRRAAHRALAARVGDIEQRARHLALAAAQPDPAVSALLARAAIAARARGAPVVGAELIELSLRMSREPEDGERLLLAAALQFDAGDLLRAQALLERACEVLPAGGLRARGLQRLGQLHGRRNNFTAALEFARQALAQAGADELVLRAEIELDVAFCKAGLGDRSGSARHARSAVASAEQAGSEPLLGHALACAAISEFMAGLGIPERDLKRSLALEGPLGRSPLALQPSYIHGILLLWTGRPREALETLEAIRRDGLERGIDSELPVLFLFLVWASLWSGDLPRAARYVDWARTLAAALQDRMAVALSLVTGALLDAHLGNARAARDQATRAGAAFEELRDRANGIGPIWALGFLELSLGNPLATDAALGEFTRWAVAVPGDPALLVFLPDEIEALVQLGRLELADQLLSGFEDAAVALDRGWAIAAAGRCRGMLRAASGDLDGALEQLEHALRRHTAQMPFERARTLLALGEVQRRRKQKRLARLAIEEALAAFESIGAPLWAGLATQALARVAPRLRAAGLTATEERIAKLAADGLTNRAISERAFVTVSTVEANLTRAYRKLGISSRAQLARALDATQAQAAQS